MTLNATARSRGWGERRRGMLPAAALFCPACTSGSADFRETRNTAAELFAGGRPREPTQRMRADDAGRGGQIRLCRHKRRERPGVERTPLAGGWLRKQRCARQLFGTNYGVPAGPPGNKIAEKVRVGSNWRRTGKCPAGSPAATRGPCVARRVRGPGCSCVTRQPEVSKNWPATSASDHVDGAWRWVVASVDARDIDCRSAEVAPI